MLRGFCLACCRLATPLQEPTYPTCLPLWWPPNLVEVSRCHILHGSSLFGAPAASPGHRAGGRRGAWLEQVNSWGMEGVFQVSWV